MGCPFLQDIFEVHLLCAEHCFLYGQDVFDKEVIGSRFAFRCRCQEAIEALQQAVLVRFPDGKALENLSLTLRLDRGCQCTAFDFTQASKNLNISIEFCDVQAPNQKSFLESFFCQF